MCIHGTLGGDWKTFIFRNWLFIRRITNILKALRQTSRKYWYKLRDTIQMYFFSWDCPFKLLEGLSYLSMVFSYTRSVSVSVVSRESILGKQVHQWVIKTMVYIKYTYKYSLSLWFQLNYWKLGFLRENSTTFWQQYFFSVGFHQHRVAFLQSESGNVNYPWFYSESKLKNILGYKDWGWVF